jgi:hypothetical protein
MAAYIYGLLSGCVHKKGWNTFKKEAAIDTVNALRIVPKGTILTVLGILCGVYLTFLLSQTPYFFSGFSGKRPEGWLVYSEYARRGFFELCQIAAINLGVLAAANLLSVNHRNAWKALKVFNVVLMLMTLLFIATAFSKMALYIHAYGLSMPRLLPCVFMAFMAIVCCGVILLQKWTFSIVRFAAFTGAVMLCFLIVSDPDGLVVRYNTGRFLNGSLQGYDTEILYRAGPAGVVPALDVFAVTEDEEQKANLITYFKDQLSAAEQARDAPGYDLQSERARRAILSSQAYLKP